MSLTSTKASSVHSGRPQGNVECPRIAMIGCGAIAELYHLPALQRHREVRQRLVLVDGNAKRTEELAQRLGIRTTATDYRDILGEIDGAIVATPPDSHFPICFDLLGRGISVLCEKPLVSHAEQAADLVQQAESTGAVLCVNHTRRLFQAYAKVRELITDGTLGTLQSIEYVDGQVFNWPTASGFYFQEGARGVLFDRGIHSLDLVCWWLGAKPELVSSRNDSFGGPESLALIELAHQQCRVKIKLSWLTKLQNYYRLVGDRATVEGGIEEWGSLRLMHKSGKTEMIKLGAREIKYNDFGKRMLTNFVEVLQGRAEPAVPASEVVAASELIDEAYERAERLELPWLYNGGRADG